MNVKPDRDNSFAADTFEERHFTLAEIAVRWRISHEKARRLFHNEPGVVRFHDAKTLHERTTATESRRALPNESGSV